MTLVGRWAHSGSELRSPGHRGIGQGLAALGPTVSLALKPLMQMEMEGVVGQAAHMPFACVLLHLGRRGCCRD